MSAQLLPLTLIVAVGHNGAIGRKGALPWRVPEDLKHFKEATSGHAIIMGRKTFESIGRALPGRRNIVVSRSKKSFADDALGKPHPEGVEIYATLTDAIAHARETDPNPRVIGGGAIYVEAMPLATELLVTYVSEETAGDLSDCDAFFPAVDETVFALEDERAFTTPGVSLHRYIRRTSP